MSYPGDLSGLFGGTSRPGTGNPQFDAVIDASLKNAKKPTAKTAGPLPQIRGKRFNGVLYVRAEDMADCLEIQVPNQAKRLITKLRNAIG